MSLNWVMLSPRGEVVKLPAERILLKPSSRISLEISPPRSLQTGTPFRIDSSDGEVYLTNQRIIYLPARPTEQFKSFAAPILNFEDSHISSPWFGSWYWLASVKPVLRGGIPPELFRVEIKLSFKDGGHNEFRDHFEAVKERLHHARELEREFGVTVLSPDEQLPAYQLSPDTVPIKALRSDLPAEVEADQPSSSASRAHPAPDEPPPTYEDVQAEALIASLESSLNIGNGKQRL